ncbi:MAG: hypothetical protein JRF17_02590 [Deltaproteobacteria bacterium]|jgi:hypothetical protein|nr:hypothetical protein [Deltaproteobacteria bacterium]
MQRYSSTYEKQLQELFLNKSDLIIDFPEWLLSQQTIENYRSISKLALVEIAGRDSIAAAVKSAQENGFTDLLPTYVYTGTEYGPWDTVNQALFRLMDRLPHVRVHPLIVLGSPDFWRALNGVFISELLSLYNFYTPCIGCHVYLHAVRIPLAILLGNIPIISGERERHNGSVKINQIPEALDNYKRLTETFEIQLLFPIRNISRGQEIEAILKMDWHESKEQLYCCLSGNYRLVDGSVKMDKKQVVRYLNEFGIPCVENIIRKYLSGNIPNHTKIAKQTIRELISVGSTQ